MAAPKRRFIHWSRPLLKETVGHLLGLHADADKLDLSQYTLLLPTSRAGRRLMEMLVQACPPGRVLMPPKITTPGQLPELLYKPRLPVAQPLIARLARARALSTLPREHLEKVIPHPPDLHQTVHWLRLAADFENLAAELAAENLLTADLGKAQSQLHNRGMLGFDDQERWTAIAAAEAAYRAELEKHQLIDPHQARQEALEKAEIKLQGNLLIVAAPALSRLLTAMIARIADQTQVIIHAPENLADSFDAAGNLIVQAWAARDVPLDDSQIRFVNRPQDQALEVVRLLAEDLPGEQAGKPAEKSGAAYIKQIDTDRITIGLGDSSQGKPIAHALELAGLRGRIAQGQTIRAGRVCVLLEVLANFVRDRRTSDLALLARQPDLEDWLRLQGINDQTQAATRVRQSQNQSAPAQQTPAEGPEPETGKTTGQQMTYLACLDQAITRHLPLKASAAWPGDSAADTTAKTIVALIDEKLLPPNPDQERRADLWVDDFLGMLQRLYGHRTLHNHNTRDEPIIRALTALREACAQIAFCESARSLLPQVDFAGFAGLLLSSITQPVPSPSMPGSIELLGWLELHLDDADRLIVTSFNEGLIPESITHDTLLPGSLRAALKINDNQARFARDTYALCAILASRPWVRLIACRRSSDDRPMTPSRLLVKSSDTITIARRIHAFSDHTKTDAQERQIIAAGGQSLFLPPLPAATSPRQVFRVTELADFVRCPYRYYLKHIQKVRSQDDQARELDALSFGNLVHEVLKEFGVSDLTDSTDASKIKDFLLQTLSDKAHRLLGPYPPAPALIQLKLIENRLERFAVIQAREARAGWRIVKGLTEAELETRVDVDGTQITLVGAIDRVDLSDTEGYRVLDYKTGGERTTKACFKPDAQGPYRWTDYQLPLYHFLLSDYLKSAGQARASEAPAIGTGYFNLPHKNKDSLIDIARWKPDQLDTAMDEARSIIRLVRAEQFWPPSKPPVYDDGLSALCHDNDISRQDVIARIAKSIAVNKSHADGGVGE